MTKRIVFFLSLVLLLSGCEKVNLADYLEKSADGYEITFCMSKFIVTDFTRTADGDVSAPSKVEASAKDLGTVVNFAVFMGEEKVKTINQKIADADFGTVKVVLPAGDYHIVALVHSCSGNATISSPAKITFPNNKVTDTFVYTTDLTVGEDQTIEAELQRVVAMFRFTVEDAIPADVTKMQFYYTGGSSTLNADSGFGCVNSRQTEVREVADHAAGQVFEVYTFPHDLTGTLSMTITAFDANGGEYAARTLANVPVEQQKITNCSMEFFGGGGTPVGSAFTFYGDSEWRGEIKYDAP